MVPREVAEEGGGFSTEAPDNDETRPSRARELAVCLAPLATSGGLPCQGVRRRLRLAGSRNRTDGGCINRELRPVPKGQAVRDDLNATRVADRNIDVHVSEPDVACNARTALPADAAERCSPRVLRRPRNRQRRGAKGSGKRSRRRMSTRRCSGGRATVADVGSTVRARPERGPACESSSARDARVRWERCVSSARSSQAATAARCQPRSLPAAQVAVPVRRVGSGTSVLSVPIGCRKASLTHSHCGRAGGGKGWWHPGMRLTEASLQPRCISREALEQRSASASLAGGVRRS